MKTYEDFVLEYTGRDMEYHKRSETWGLESGRAAWDAAIAAERERWVSAIGAVMPADFKDWHETSASERPDIAAWVINNLRNQVDFLAFMVENLTAK